MFFNFLSIDGQLKPHNFNHSCQNVNRIVNRFLIFSYRIVYRKIHKHLLKFIKFINIHI